MILQRKGHPVEGPHCLAGVGQVLVELGGPGVGGFVEELEAAVEGGVCFAGAPAEGTEGGDCGDLAVPNLLRKLADLGESEPLGTAAER